MTVFVGRLWRAWLAALLLMLVLPAAADVAVPALRARVTDLTATLDAAQQATLEKKLADFEAKKARRSPC